MKHFVNIINLTPQQIEMYATDASAEFIEVGKTIKQYKIRISKYEFSRILEANKTYFYFEEVNSSIFKSRGCVFIYNPKDEKYHIGSFYTSSDFTNKYDINTDMNNNQFFIFDDITENLFRNPDYYKSYYCRGGSNNFYFYDEEKECILDAYSADIIRLLKKLDSVEQRYFYLNQEHTYKREFDKMFNDAIEKIKQEIFKKLENEKTCLKNSIDEYNMTVSNLDYERNKVLRDVKECL